MSLKDLIHISERNLEQMEMMRSRLGALQGPDASSWLASAWGHAARRCVFCRSSQTCAAWLAAGAVDEQYHDFCPNAYFFDHLREQA